MSSSVGNGSEPKSFQCQDYRQTVHLATEPIPDISSMSRHHRINERNILGMLGLGTRNRRTGRNRRSGLDYAGG